MLSLISQLIQTIKEFLVNRTASIENQTTSEVVKDKKRLKRASDITERILLLVDKYKDSFEKDDEKLYQKLKKMFLKAN